MAGRATQERTLGAILGLGIGDALGIPVSGMNHNQIQSKFGAIETYHSRTFEDGTELAAGEFSDDTEIALCIMETYTSANGQLDPELIRARMQFLARGESRRWMNAETVRSLDDDHDPWYRSTSTNDPEVALRGVAIGIIHAAATIDEVALYRDVETVVGLTHSDRAAVDQAALVAVAVALVLAGGADRSTLLPSLIAFSSNDELSVALERLRLELTERNGIQTIIASTATGNDAIDAITGGIAAFVQAERFEDGVFAAASAGGPADSRAALAGALVGARFGAGGIPQVLIDDLEGRIYLTLAAPWFYRTVQLLSGRGLSMDSAGA